MGRAVPGAGAGEAVVWVYLAQVHILGNKQPFSQRAAALGK